MQAQSAITALPAASKEERGEQEQRIRLSSLAREFAEHGFTLRKQSERLATRSNVSFMHAATSALGETAQESRPRAVGSLLSIVGCHPATTIERAPRGHLCTNLR